MAGWREHGSSVVKLVLQNILMLVFMLIFAVVRVMMSFSPALQDVIAKNAEKMRGRPFEKQEKAAFLEHEFGTIALAKHLGFYVTQNMFKSARLGRKSPDPEVFNLKGDVLRLISDLSPRERYLVLNFGSLTCPSFIGTLEDFRTLSEQYADIAKFVVVYMAEAHAADGWKLCTQKYTICRHKSLQDRIKAAVQVVEKLPSVQVVCDNMADSCGTGEYAANPVRLGVVKDGQLIFLSGLGPKGYDISELQTFLQDECSAKTCVPRKDE